MPARPPRILVADDDFDILGLLVRALESLPCEVRAVADGQAAIDAFEEEPPDLAILDIHMPKFSGADLCRRFKSADPERYLPVVLITSDTDRSLREEALDGGADEYLIKPFSAFDVRARARPLLRAKFLHDDLRRTRAELLDLRRAMDGEKLRRTFGPPVRKEISVLFADVRNFTKMSDQMDPEDVHSMLDGYIGQAADAVLRHGGTINKIMGDGVMALFGDRDDRDDHPLQALRAALEMSERAAALQAKMYTILPESFEIGIGVHSGNAIVGTLGSGDHVDYTAIGSTVNLAARLQGLSTNNRVVASASTYDAFRTRVDVANERREQMKGFAHPIRVGDVVRIL